MPRPLLRAAAAALALAAPALARGDVTRAQVLDAIRVFEANAVAGASSRSPGEANAAVARASNLILRFAVESADVVVDLGPDAVPWCDLKKGLPPNPTAGQRGLLLAAYVSGCVSAQLQSGRQDPGPLEGWLAMLRVYRAMRATEGASIPEVEELLARQVNGSLGAYASDAHRRSLEHLRGRYGAPQAPQP